MDKLYFLKERTKFIWYFYETASQPFRQTIEKIETSEYPFEPPYSEDGEPPFMEEWHEASIALAILGRTCVSMLSGSLKLYFKTLAVAIGIPCEKTCKKVFKDEGFVRGYRACFGEALKLKWDECPADFAILEQIALARNSDQHTGSITTLHATHSQKDHKQYPQLIFINDTDKDLFLVSDANHCFFMNPTLHVSRETLFTAIEEVELLAKWLEKQTPG